MNFNHVFNTKMSEIITCKQRDLFYFKIGTFVKIVKKNNIETKSIAVLNLWNCNANATVSLPRFVSFTEELKFERNQMEQCSHLC